MNPDSRNQVLSTIKELNQVSQEVDTRCESFLLGTALNHDGYIQILMSLTLDKSLSEAERLKSLIVLKRVLISHSKTLKDSEIQVFKDNILECLKLSPSLKIGSIYCEILYSMLLKLYPKLWPGFETKIRHELFNAKNADQLFWMLKAFCKLTKLREHSIDTEDILLKNESTKICFPKFEEFISGLLQSGPSKQNLMIMHILVKIFCKSVRYGCPDYFKIQEKAALWMGFLDQISKAPALTGPINDDLLKCKKWASRSLVPFFRTYGKPRNLKNSEEHNKFAQFFSENLLQGLLNTIVENAKAFNRGTSSSIQDIIMLNHVRCISHSFKNLNFFPIHKSFFVPLILQNLIPKLAFNEKDKEVYENDSMEYYRRNDDLLTNVTSREGILSFAYDLFQKYPEDLLTYINQLISNNISLQMKEAYYVVLEKCHDFYLGDKKYAAFIDQFFSQVVAKDVESEFGFIKMRCWRLVYVFASNPIQVEVLYGLYNSLGKDIEHKDLPVRCNAALALNSMMTVKEMESKIKPHLKDVLVVFVKLMNEIDNDTLINSLKSIFERFQNEIAPFAIELIDSIVKICIKMKIKFEEMEENNQDIDCFAYLSGVSSLEFLVRQIQDQNQLVQATEILTPMFVSVFEDMDLESFEEVVHLISTIISRNKGVLIPKIQMILEFFFYGLGEIEKVQEMIQNNIPLNNDFLKMLKDKTNNDFMEYSSCITALFRNLVYSHWGFLQNNRDSLNQNYLELMYKMIDRSMKYTSEILDSTNKVSLLMLQSTMVLTCKRNSPELLSNSLFLRKSIEDSLALVSMCQAKEMEESNYPVYLNCALNNIGIGLFSDLTQTLRILRETNQLKLLTENIQVTLPQLLTSRTMKAFLIGLLNLINELPNLNDMELLQFVQGSNLLSLMNIQIFKLYVYKIINSEELTDEDLDITEFMPIEMEFEKVLKTFDDDALFKQIRAELSQANEHHHFDIETLMSFDFDICDELFEDINEFQFFHQVISNQKVQNPILFESYLANTSATTQKNLQKLFQNMGVAN